MSHNSIVAAMLGLAFVGTHARGAEGPSGTVAHSGATSRPVETQLELLRLVGLLDKGNPGGRLDALNRAEQVLSRDRASRGNGSEAILRSAERIFADPGVLPQTEEDLAAHDDRRIALATKFQALQVISLVDRGTGRALFDRLREDRNPLVMKTVAQMVEEAAKPVALCIPNLKTSQLNRVIRVLLTDPDPQIRVRTSRGLEQVAGQIGSDNINGVMDVIEDAYGREPVPAVRLALVRAAIALGVHDARVAGFIERVAGATPVDPAIRRAVEEALPGATRAGAAK